MKRTLIALGIAATAAMTTLAAAPASAAVSVAVGEPGFFGRIDIGGAPPPQVVYSQPMIIQQSPYAAQRAPVYLRVPPGQQRNWARYCANYGACGQPVYFVQEGWYSNVYAPHYREHHRYAGGPRPYGDRDRDGVPNRYDRDRDGDGIPNRYDRQPDRPSRR